MPGRSAAAGRSYSANSATTMLSLSAGGAQCQSPDRPPRRARGCGCGCDGARCLQSTAHARDVPHGGLCRCRCGAALQRWACGSSDKATFTSANYTKAAQLVRHDVPTLDARSRRSGRSSGTMVCLCVEESAHVSLNTERGVPLGRLRRDPVPGVVPGTERGVAAFGEPNSDGNGEAPSFLHAVA